MTRTAGRAASLLLVLAAAAAAPAGAAMASAGTPPAKPRAKAPSTGAVAARPGTPGSATDFSGIWNLDDKASALGSHHMEDAELEVTQKGNHIWIQPLGRTRSRVMAEEVVVDGRSYQKSLGNHETGTLTALWGKDGKSLWLEVVASTDENPRAAFQRSQWRLSADRNVWVRETTTMNKGSVKQSRLVFRRQEKKPR